VFSGRWDLFVDEVVFGPGVEHFVDAEGAVLGVAAGGAALGWGEAADEGNGVGAHRGEGGQGGAGSARR